MKYPDNHDPSHTSTAAVVASDGATRRRPYSSTPRKIDSRKNAKTPSSASGWPTTAPACAENAAQFVPNWNSIGIPVTTPAAKLSVKIFVQKSAAAPFTASPERPARQVYQATNGASPIVPIGNR